MKNQYWHDRWQTDNIQFDQEVPNPFLVKYFKTLQLEKESRILVPLCGKSVDMLWLSNQGYEIIGAELSELGCRAFFEENAIAYQEKAMQDFLCFTGDNITLYAGDYFKLSSSLIGPIQGVYDRAAMIALPESVRSRYVQHTHALLSDQAKGLLITIAYDESTMQGPPFSIDRTEVTKVMAHYFKLQLLVDEPQEVILPHYKDKGLTKANDLIYQIQKL